MSNEVLIGIIFTFLMLVLVFLGAHIGFLLVVIGVAGFAVLGGLSGAIGNLTFIPFIQMNSYNFAVIPLFMVMSEFVGQTSMGRETYETARAWMGQLKGGLAMATVGACALFACVSGSSLAGSVVMGRVAYPEMKRLGYAETLSSGVVAAGGSLGTMIPPSMGFIVIGILANVSIGKLFLAGIIPGITMMVCYWIAIAILCRINPRVAPSTAHTTAKEKVTSISKTWPIVILFVLMMGGIYGGIFTATEAAGIGAFGALMICLARRQMTGEKLWACLMETSKMVAMIVIMMVGAFLFNSFLAISRIPTEAGNAMAALPVSRWVLLVAIIIFYLVLGMFFDVMAILIITIPILYPAIEILNFNLIWYSVLMMRIVEIGFISPPFGITLFALSSIIKVPLGTMYRGIIPFCIADVFNVGFLIAFPVLSLWLPSHI